MDDKTPLQVSVTRIGADVFRVVVQSKTKTLYTANVERKNLEYLMAKEMFNLAVIPWQWESSI